MELGGIGKGLRNDEGNEGFRSKTKNEKKVVVRKYKELEGLERREWKNDERLIGKNSREKRRRRARAKADYENLRKIPETRETAKEEENIERMERIFRDN
ncbi:hypothetical protein K0M31_007394 [Melipona bicolor]|uniref:Uncharacterized protein n=1 Tax=Melipona bicolor TaxID=60889 RepID=A0AA40KVL8_9HYME|nr:hypothetical protein K0M31_007394 [Melipona bicolor]